jgi:hypothetical protein
MKLEYWGALIRIKRGREISYTKIESGILFAKLYSWVAIVTKRKKNYYYYY